LESIEIAPIFNPVPEDSLEVVTHNVIKHSAQLIPVIELPLLQSQEAQNSSYQFDQILSKKLDLQRDQLSQQTNILGNVIKSSVTISSAFSIGYIIWLVRGGLLIGSVLATLPVWRFIDPIPVLKQFNGDGYGDDETLETIVGTDENTDKNTNKKIIGKQRRDR